MTNTIHIVVAICLLVTAAQPVRAANPQPASGTDAADALFKAGKFAEAGKIYAQIAARDSLSYVAPFRLGSIALLSNELDDAQKWLQQARKIRPINSALDLLLAEI